ncbi:Phospho-2-dehydro-3-deoxyheptonate aldolase 2, chloroplastic [Gracilariopsis chorda]|uniref:Phospho-2-dehydro-3-deoxyheptonate aldolase n=1 Tax=Gracilariopsis chorda TaxID=448386 RepID=A0A2V3ILE3_9FLOR|nr:Phospho-2-dehydro-3-deoxyheptonate aldolase 2, chloroplastic [Gracilariopsis chorda]|eukprot:PXF42905.1 Phospho-2-dehydro-3-deoxyheptonate aldolase 2, chloroplastic [Gracilariopsis chorda]
MNAAFLAPTALPVRARRASPAVHPLAPRMVATEPPRTTRLWTPHSWRTMPIKQLPKYPDQKALREMEQRLERSLPLVFSGECEALKELLAKASRGQAFVIQGGDCAESFKEFDAYGGKNISDTFTLVIQMSIMLMYALRRPVVKILRAAGQFAKPRSSPYEKKKNQELSLPSYRGDIINGSGFTQEERIPDPERMYKAFVQSTATINLLRTLASGGALDLHRVHDISLKFVRETSQGRKYAQYATDIDNAIAFMEAIGLQSDSYKVRQAEFYVSHESLLLPYEQALCRQDPITGKHYATSGHFLWLGDRTRQPDGAHVEFMRGISNPIGIKCGPTLTPDDLVQLLDILNPDNEPGRITLITRVGAGKVADNLPTFIETIKREGRDVVWSCDPCHGNTETTASGFKTRRFENIMQEVTEFFAVHESMGTYPGGVHLELTGQDVTECVGGMMELTDEDLKQRYETHCDPRLNASQALELALKLSEEMQNRCIL